MAAAVMRFVDATVATLERWSRGTAAAVWSYIDALREEPKLRYFFLWTLIDDVGTAVAAWAGTAFNNDVVKTPDAEAAVAVPALWATIIGNILGGPLADWPGNDPDRLAKWRYKITVWRNAIHLAFLIGFVIVLATGHKSLGFKVGYTTISHFISTLTGATRTAYFVDLLKKEKLQQQKDGTLALDDRGRPKEYKVHLLTAHSLLHQTEKFASFIGIVGGGYLLKLVSGDYWMLYAAHAMTYVAFAVGIAVTCHPTLPWRSFSFRQLLREASATPAPRGARALLVGLVRAKDSAVALGRFIVARENYTLAMLLITEWIVKLSSSMFNTRLLLTQVLGQDLEFFRWVEIVKTMTTVVVTFFVVALKARVRVLGWIVVGAVIAEGAARVIAGVLGTDVHAVFEKTHEAPPLIYFMVATLVFAGASAVVVGALTSLAHQSCSSSALRGQIIAGVLLIDTLASMASQALFPPLSHWLGQPQLLAWAGGIQIVVVVAMLGLPKRGPGGFAIIVPEAPAESTRVPPSAPWSARWLGPLSRKG